MVFATNSTACTKNVNTVTFSFWATPAPEGTRSLLPNPTKTVHLEGGVLPRAFCHGPCAPSSHFWTIFLTTFSSQQPGLPLPDSSVPSVPCWGVVERKGDQAWLRSPLRSYSVHPSDPFVPTRVLRALNLKTGDTVQGRATGGDKPRLTQVDTANGVEARNGLPPRLAFEDLTALFPRAPLVLETQDGSQEDVSRRMVDLLAPQGKGQRALIVSPPKVGKTTLLTHIAQGIERNHPDCVVLIVLIDERPEEVTELQRLVNAEVVASTFDAKASAHIRVAEMTIERAKRLVEQGKDVVVLLDSITRLARAYNSVVPNSGKILSGGVDANALHYPKRVFGAARNTEEAGSLTVIATALVDTGSVMDQVIFEEFKGTGNSEIHLDRRLSEKRLHPSVHIGKSGTRREELLVDEATQHKTVVLRRLLHGMDETSAHQFLLDKLKSSKSRAAFFQAMMGKT